MEGKQRKGKLVTKMKKLRRDELIELPDSVLLHIMKFMDTKYAIQTCVLSKRWKNLWKSLTNLTFNSSHFSTLNKFTKFVSFVLSNRDDSISLLDLDFKRHGSVEPKFLNRLIKYVVLHNVQHLTIDAKLSFRANFEFPSFIFNCQFLSSLKLCIKGVASMKMLPKSLQLPALKILHLEYFTFTACDNDLAEPFSSCYMLSSLVMGHCSLHNDAKRLSISNSKLSSLTILSSFEGRVRDTSLSTPNLVSLTIMGYSNQQLSSTCNLSFLEEVNIHVVRNTDFVTIISWLQMFANVKTMTLSSSTLEILLKDLSNPGLVKSQPPSFARLESLKVEMKQYSRISDKNKKLTSQYLLQNSPFDTIDIINY
uniref:F-box/LRR-repeat protein 13 n=1 Tax=Cajanus cajan TaxID=3821 RepID=A0A151RRM0_CAJCA|nr:F-box/LRR-repeat protein 13 [Cajanus cajan]